MLGPAKVVVAPLLTGEPKADSPAQSLVLEGLCLFFWGPETDLGFPYMLLLPFLPSVQEADVGGQIGQGVILPLLGFGPRCKLHPSCGPALNLPLNAQRISVSAKEGTTYVKDPLSSKNTDPTSALCYSQTLLPFPLAPDKVFLMLPVSTYQFLISCPVLSNMLTFCSQIIQQASSPGPACGHLSYLPPEDLSSEKKVSHCLSD